MLILSCQLKFSDWELRFHPMHMQCWVFKSTLPPSFFPLPLFFSSSFSLLLTEAEFDDGKQATFRAAIAAAPGVSSANVTIVKFTSISSARRGGEICDARRHLL